ncbi:hypothetical protein P3T76_002514 [Phytophthora citrophthora]|uniref:Uncharacterized protein n=1 Tax=Phytophthora citrophthora TaxID=4793 RepID=A0AAD9GWR2_9STRA|nr:hypothetical protein P3T76_002514 [Phytophthora citrophthora]
MTHDVLAALHLGLLVRAQLQELPRQVSRRHGVSLCLGVRCVVLLGGYYAAQELQEQAGYT